MSQFVKKFAITSDHIVEYLEYLILIFALFLLGDTIIQSKQAQPATSRPKTGAGFDIFPHHTFLVEYMFLVAKGQRSSCRGSVDLLDATAPSMNHICPYLLFFLLAVKIEMVRIIPYNQPNQERTLAVVVGQ